LPEKLLAAPQPYRAGNFGWTGRLRKANSIAPQKIHVLLFLLCEQVMHQFFANSAQRRDLRVELVPKFMVLPACPGQSSDSSRLLNRIK
jgi:hypothetical protein